MVQDAALAKTIEADKMHTFKTTASITNTYVCHGDPVAPW